MSDESTITGRGREVLLPPQGNPFKKEGSGEEPRELSPAEIAARFGGTTAASPVGESTAEPADLKPEDVAALFPSTHDERNVIPGAVEETAAASTAALSSADIAATPPAPVDTAPRASPAPPSAIDIAAFNPDAAIGELAAAPAETLPAATMVDASSLKADAPPPENIPLAAPESAIAPASPAPAVGFKPLNPFAPPASATIAGRPSPAASSATPPALSEMPLTRGAADMLEASMANKRDLGAEPAAPVAEEDKMVDLLITERRLQELWTRIDMAEKAVVEDDSSLPDQRALNLENIRTARNLLLGGRKNYEDALRYVAEVEADIRYAGRVRRWSYTYGMVLLAFDFVILALLFLGYLNAGRIVAPFSEGGVFDAQFGFVLWVTILAGGLGGVTKSLFSLVTHIIEQDFDTQHRIWYWTSPLIGAVLAILVMFFVQLGLTSVGTSVSVNTNSGLVSYTLAWIVGFQQNLVFELIERVKKMILGPSREEKETTSPPPLSSGGPEK